MSIKCHRKSNYFNSTVSTVQSVITVKTTIELL